MFSLVDSSLYTCSYAQYIDIHTYMYIITSIYEHIIDTYKMFYTNK